MCCIVMLSCIGLGADQYMQPKFTDYPVDDEFYAAHLEQWWTYCDEASDESFPTYELEL